MRILAIHFPSLALDRLMQARPALRERPFALLEREGNRVFLVAVNEAAALAGLAPGMGLADARAAYPALEAEAVDPAKDLTLLRQKLRWASTFSPRVGRSGLSGLWLDTTGADHLFGGETAMLARMKTELGAAGLHAGLALAPHGEAARALAAFDGNLVEASAANLKDKLDPLPAGALALTSSAQASCQRLGLRTLGDLRRLPRASLARRFGLESSRALDALYGLAAEPLQPSRHRQRYLEAQSFMEPLISQEGLEQALTPLFARLTERLEAEHQSFRQLWLKIQRIDGEIMTFKVGSSRPVHRAELLWPMMLMKLDGLEIGFGLEELQLRAEAVKPRLAEQETLHPPSDQPPSPRGPNAGESKALRPGLGASQAESLAMLKDRLAAKLGADQVLTFHPALSHIPERAFSAESVLYASPKPAVWPVNPGWRPLLLYTSPASLCPGPAADDREAHPPAWIDWNGARWALEAVSGPEKIAPEWWWDHPLWRSGTRCYWWVWGGQGRAGAPGTPRTGVLLWIFRPEKEARWYLHGLCA